MQKKTLTFPFIEQNRQTDRQTDRQTENESSVGLFGCSFSPRRLPSVSDVPKERKKERAEKQNFDQRRRRRTRSSERTEN
jgi:hypothetical protein